MLAPDQITAIAPDAASLKAGRDLGSPRKWQSLCGDEESLWSIAMGSGIMKALLTGVTVMCSLSSLTADDQRGVEVQLPDQENNRLKTSLSGVGCWFWVGRDFQPEGYESFLELYAKHTNLKLLTTSIRHDRWIGDPKVHDLVKTVAALARKHDMALVFDLDIRHSRESFRKQYPRDQQELVRMKEVTLKPNGSTELAIEGIKLADHYTLGPAPDYNSYASRLLRVYSYLAGKNGLAEDVRDITDRCLVQRADGNNLVVSIPGTAEDTGRTACVLAAFTLFTPDVFSPHLQDFEKKLLAQYADVSLAGACKDEWGFPGRFDPTSKDLWYSDAMATAYTKRRPSHDLAKDMFLMHRGETGREAERAAAINHTMQMTWQRCAEIENHYYDAIKELFGDQAMAMTHPTWVPFPDKREIFKNGLHWWAAKRDVAQTDESTPYCVRTALTKKWHSPLWLNMYYSSKINNYHTELWQSVLGGGRINYHQIFPYPDWLKAPDWNQAMLKSPLMRAEARVQLLNCISTKPIDCPVAVIFGHAATTNWTEANFSDVGIKVTDQLWQSGYYADLIPSSEIASGALRIGEDGHIQYGAQRYSAAVLYNPQYEGQPTLAFCKQAATGKTRLWRTGVWNKDFEAKPLDADALLPEAIQMLDGNAVAHAVIAHLKSTGLQPFTRSAPNKAHYGSSMVPGTSGSFRLLDGTVIHASGTNDVMGDPIQKTFSINDKEVSFDAIGIAAVRLDAAGKLEAMAAGGLKSFKGGGISIDLTERTDVALWKNANGTWQGVLLGHQGPVPEALSSICNSWTRLRFPEALR